MNCKEDQKIYKAKTNGEQSILHGQLLDTLVSPDEANEIHQMMYSNDFKELFGDFENTSSEFDIDFSNRLDKNGEPRLITNKYNNEKYILDKYNQRVYYLKGKQGLNKILSKSDIISYANSIASDYFLDNLEIDKETFSINNLEDNKGLDKFIEEQLKKDSEYLQESEDFVKSDLGFALEDSIDFIDEWKQEVKDVYSAIKIEMKNIEDAQDFVDQQEEFRGELMRKESFLKSSKDNVNNNIKLMLSLVPSVQENAYGKTELVKFFDIYTSISNETRGLEALDNEDMYDIFVEKIENMANAKPYLHYLLDNYLKNPKYLNENFKNKFVNAFTLYKNNFLTSEIIKGETALNYNVKNISEVGSRRNHIIKEWVYNKSQNLDTVKEDLNEINITEKAISKLENEEELKNYLKDSVLHELNNLGINITNKELNLFLDNRNFQEQSFEDRKKNLLRLYSDITRSLKSPLLYEDQTTLKELADAKAFFMNSISDSSLYTMGKNKWINSLPSHLDRITGLWKKDYELLENLYDKNDPHQESSFYLKYLLGYVNENNKELNLSEDKRIDLAKERIEKIEIGNFNSIQEKDNLSNSVDNKGVKELDAVVDYVNKALSLNKDYQKTALAADKNTEYQIHYGTKIFSKAKLKEKDNKQNIKVSKSVEDIFFNYVNGEYKRAKKVFKEINDANGDTSKLVPNYHTKNQNGKKILTIPGLSINFEKGNVILPELSNQIYDSTTGEPLYTDLLNDKEVEKEIRVKIRNFISDNIKDTYKKLLDDKIIYVDSNNKIRNNFISRDIDEYYSKNYSNDAYINVAADLFINGFISQVEYSKLFTGDVAYYKNIPDYKKRVPASYTDGQYLNRLTEDEKNMNISIFDSIEQKPYNFDKIPEELQPLYENTNATDAQAYITPQRWRFLLEKLGKWNNTFDEVYDKILKGDTDFSKKEIALMQPLKGVYFYRDNTNKPIFLKYSQAVLIPGVVKNTELDSLYNKMIKDSEGNTLEYKDQIHELIAKDGIKVGAITPSKIHNEDGSLNENFELNKMSIPNRGWKLQQDLPTKGFKQTDVGSQIQKIIFQGLSKYMSPDSDVKFDFQGEEYSAAEMANILNDITSDMSNEMFSKFKKQYGINDAFEIENKDLLINSLVSQLKERKAPKNIINALESNISPAAIPGQYELFQNVFSSLTNKASVKIKTNGAGFIQMSDFGLNYNEAISKKGIRFTPEFKKQTNKEGYNSKRLLMPQIEKNKDGKEIVKGGGIFLPSGFVSKYVKDWRDYSDEELFGKLNEETGRYENGIIPQEAIENIIGYRIPNQGLASNDNFVIAGILPESMGDTAIPYVGLTTKTGSDFDIDKLYLMIPILTPIYGNEIISKAKKFVEKDLELNEEDIKNELLYEGFSDSNLQTYDELLDFYIRNILFNNEDLLKEFGEDVKANILEYDSTINANKLIEAYKSVLTNKEVYKDLINPIDIDYIKNDALALNKLKGVTEVKAFDSLEDIVTKLKFMQGKAGLGQAVNQLVDFVRGTIDPVTFNVNDEITTALKKHVNFRGNSSTIELDKIDSKNLTQKELTEYVKFFNENLTEEEADKKLTVKKAKEELKSVEIKDSLTALVNAFVDIAKDSYIIDVNWTTNTNNVGLMLLRMGMHPFKINAFLGQNVLKDYIKFKNDQESNIVGDRKFLENKYKSKLIKDSLKSDFEKNVFKVEGYNLEGVFEELINRNNNVAQYKSEQAFKILDSKFKQLVKKETGKLIEVPGYNDILNDIVEKLKYAKDEGQVKQDFNLTSLRSTFNNSNFFQRIDTLNSFLTLDKGAKLLNQSINATKFDVSGKGKNNSTLLLALNNINQMTNDPTSSGNEFIFNGFINKINNTFLNSYFKNSLYEPFEMIKNSSNLFPTLTESAINTYFTFLNVEKKNDLKLVSEKDLKQLQKDYYTYMFKDFKPFDISTEEKSNILKFMPERLEKMKNKYPNNFLLKNLYSEQGDNGIYFVKASPTKKDENVVNNINDDFDNLSEIEKDFTDDLVRYSYLVSGFNNDLNSFNDFISEKWFRDNNLNQHISKVTKDASNSQIQEKFLNEYIANNSLSLDSYFKLSPNNYKYNGTILAGFEEGQYAKLPLVIAKDENFFYQLRENFDGMRYYELRESKGYKDTKGNKFKEYYSESILKNKKKLTDSQKIQINTFKEKNNALTDHLFKSNTFKGFNLDPYLNQTTNDQINKEVTKDTENDPFTDESNC